MKTLYIFILTIFICSANGFAQTNKKSSKKSSENSNFIVKETENKTEKEEISEFHSEELQATSA